MPSVTSTRQLLEDDVCDNQSEAEMGEMAGIGMQGVEVADLVKAIEGVENTTLGN